MKRIGIVSDIHGNLQALEAIMGDMKNKKLDKMICLGDVIAIGPSPKECLDLILNEDIKLVLGNHEEYFIEGTDNFKEVGSDERKHQNWVKAQLNEALREQLKQHPFIIKERIGNTTYGFMHYARKSNRFIYINEERHVENLDKMFSNIEADVILYGHEHHLEQTKLVGKHTYICVGSSGCRKDTDTYYTILTIDDDQYRVEKVEIEYDREKFIDTINNLTYPERAFLSKRFFGINCIDK